MSESDMRSLPGLGDVLWVASVTLRIWLAGKILGEPFLWLPINARLKLALILSPSLHDMRRLREGAS